MRESQTGVRRKSAAALKDTWERASFYTGRSTAGRYEQLNLRLRRALSWLERAEKEVDDCDAAFLFHWIAFNAMYGPPRSAPTEPDREKKSFEAYLKKVSLHESERISDVMRSLSTEVEKLLANKYVFEPYWKYRNGLGCRDWEQRLRRQKRERESATGRTKTEITVCQVFDRLYTLRNQLLHGSATWKSTMNRSQVETGAKIMTNLVPHFIEVMIQHPDGWVNWGAPRYPVVRERGEQSGWTDDA